MQPGDFVVLVDDIWKGPRWDRWRGVTYPVRGPVYTVRNLSVSPKGTPEIKLEEIVNPELRYRVSGEMIGPLERGFATRRFRVLERLSPSAFMRELETA